MADSITYENVLKELNLTAEDDKMDNVEPYDTQFQPNELVNQYGFATEGSSSGVIKYALGTEEQSQLYAKTKYAYLDYSYFMTIHEIILIQIFCILCITYTICIFTIKNKEFVRSIYKYLFTVWCIYLSIWFGYSYYLWQCWRQLKLRVNNEIPRVE
jgi:hypothetical protein